MSPRNHTFLLSCALAGLLLSITTAPAAAGAAGSLDSSFGGDGKVTTNFTTGDDLALSVAVQVDGKIVAAGGAPGSGGRFAVARYNGDGTLDSTFSADGKVTTNFTSGRDFAAGVAVQADDRIVAAGTANFSGDARLALARYNPDGTLDTTFDGDGKVTTNLTSSFDAIYSVVIQSDGKIVVAGATGSGGSFAIARYNTDGTLDTTFSGDGHVATNFASGYDFADDVTIQADGKIVAAGAANYFGGDPKFALARYNTDGTPDTTFGGDGKVTTNFTGGDDFAFGVAVQPADGKIVAAGRAGGSGGMFALTRYNTDGTLDATFSGDGKATTNFTGGYDYADDVAVQPVDGKIVAAGSANAFGGNPTFGVARYDPDGTVDTTFTADGRVTTDFTGGADFAVGVALQADGKIVAAGRAGGSGGRFGLVRYLGS
jgi:uncharacterized delta-60 repeat protein